MPEVGDHETAVWLMERRACQSIGDTGRIFPQPIWQSVRARDLLVWGKERYRGVSRTGSRWGRSICIVDAQISEALETFSRVSPRRHSRGHFGFFWSSSFTPTLHHWPVGIMSRPWLAKTSNDSGLGNCLICPVERSIIDRSPLRLAREALADDKTWLWYPRHKQPEH